MQSRSTTHYIFSLSLSLSQEERKRLFDIDLRWSQCRSFVAFLYALLDNQRGVGRCKIYYTHTHYINIYIYILYVCIVHLCLHNYNPTAYLKKLCWYLRWWDFCPHFPTKPIPYFNHSSSFSSSTLSHHHHLLLYQLCI